MKTNSFPFLFFAITFFAFFVKIIILDILFFENTDLWNYP